MKFSASAELPEPQQGEPKTQANAFRVALGFFVVLAELGPDDIVIRNVCFAGRRTAKKTCTLKPQEALGKDARWFEPSRGSHAKSHPRGRLFAWLSHKGSERTSLREQT